MSTRQWLAMICMGGLLGSCGDSGDGAADATAVCNQACDKAVMCYPGVVTKAACQMSCTSQMPSTTTKTCTNQSAIVAAAKACLAKPDCAAYAACTETIPACQTTSTGGAGGAAGTGGLAGMGGITTGGTSGTTGLGGAGGSGTSGATCTLPTPVGSCVIAGSDVASACVEYYAPITTAAIMAACTGQSATYGAGSCPSTNLLGYCSLKAGTMQVASQYYYGSVATASIYQMSCGMAGGVWCTK